jgi:hypothetical protein
MLALFDKFHYVHWRVPFTDQTIWEGMVVDEAVACFRALCVVVPLLLIALAVRRLENWYESRRK